MNKLGSMTGLVFFLMLSGCSSMSGYLEIATDKGISKQYLNVLNSSTRKDIIYSQFETKALISSTYLSDAFRRAYSEEYARLYHLTEQESRKIGIVALGQSQDYREFLFYAALGQDEANDFHKENSSWRIFMIDEQGRSIAPQEIRKIGKITPLLEEFFPYINKYYGVCYSLKFPRPLPDGKTEGARPATMTLVFTGVLGKISLSWP